MLNHLKAATNVAYTENGAKAYATTESSLVDFFAQGGALRTRQEVEIISLFTKAFAEDALLAMKMLFYFRDIRSGQGERRTFRTIIKYLADVHTQALRKNIHLIPYYGRWDDLYELVGTKLEKAMFSFMGEQMYHDMRDEQPSLLAKWMKSENASSIETKRLAVKTRMAFAMSSKDYRKALSAIRQQLAIVESKMSANKWSDINYEHVPSQAAMRYRKAFAKWDTDRYTAYIESLTKGEAKINTNALFPYEIVDKVYNQREQNDTLNLMWDNLPDYIGDSHENSIAVVDTSGSMSGKPIAVALSIGLYLAERNKGVFHNHFLTFSAIPTLQEVKGKTLYEKLTNMSNAAWNQNTNIELVFKLILTTAVTNQVTHDEMIDKIYIISDMEFDEADHRTSSNSGYLFEAIKRDYDYYGYTMPKLVFWNVNAHSTQFPMKITDAGVQLVSGCSPSIFKNLMKGDFVSPYELMLEVVNDERYSLVTI